MMIGNPITNLVNYANNTLPFIIGADLINRRDLLDMNIRCDDITSDCAIKLHKRNCFNYEQAKITVIDGRSRDILYTTHGESLEIRTSKIPFQGNNMVMVNDSCFYLPEYDGIFINTEFRTDESLLEDCARTPLIIFIILV